MTTEEKVKIDIAKLREVENAINKAVTIDFENLKPIAEKSKSFEYINSENMDDPFEFKLKGIEFSKFSEDYVECEVDNSIIDKALEDEFDNEVDDFTDNVSVELSKEDIKHLKRLLLHSQAEIIATIEENLSQASIEKIESNLREIENKIKGFYYDCWDELDLEFNVDGIEYSMTIWGEELVNRESGLTIDEMEEKQNKPSGDQIK